MMSYITIPIEICQNALTTKSYRALQIFVWLKMNCSGKIIITSGIKSQIAQELGIKSKKTVNTAIHYLLDSMWITLSKKSGYYFIKGFESIRRMEGFTARTGAEFCHADIKNFKGFLVAAIITNLINIQKRRLWVTECKKGRSKTVAHKPPLFYPVANEALAKILRVSVSTAWEWKKLAQKKRFIKVRKEFQEIKMDSLFLPELRKYGDSKNTVYRKGKVFEQLPDKVATNLILKNRKKIQKSDGNKSKHIKKGGKEGKQVSD